MNALSDHEIEVKFHIQDIDAIEKILIAQEAILLQPRMHEYNLRFDKPNRELIRQGQVLRLRRDANTRLTFKGPPSIFHGVSSRPEYEFSVSDFDAARKFVEALGYQVVAIYEKYRAVYELDPVKIMIDEMPFGKFIEIEGPNPKAIQACANLLNLTWDTGLSESYMEIFERIKNSRGFGFRDLTFDNFKEIEIQFSELGVIAADQR